MDAIPHLSGRTGPQKLEVDLFCWFFFEREAKNALPREEYTGFRNVVKLEVPSGEESTDSGNSITDL